MSVGFFDAVGAWVLSPILVPSAVVGGTLADVAGVTKPGHEGVSDALGGWWHLASGQSSFFGPAPHPENQYTESNPFKVIGMAAGNTVGSVVKGATEGVATGVVKGLGPVLVIGAVVAGAFFLKGRRS